MKRILLSDEQSVYLGRLVWQHIDGVAQNVTTLLNAINTDHASGVRVLATREWNNLVSTVRQLQKAACELESASLQRSVDLIAALLGDDLAPSVAEG